MMTDLNLTPDERRRRADEATRLVADQTLQSAFDAARQEFLETLAKATDPNEITRLQARVAAIDEIRVQLDRMVKDNPRERRAVV